jgi:hypothetical protein
MINNDLIQTEQSQTKVNVIHSLLFLLLKYRRESSDFFVTCALALDVGVGEAGVENRDKSNTPTCTHSLN